jgi:serine/threonine protein phosphatase PrpC
LGDSRALLARQTLKKDWEVVSLSNDHKPDVARERIRILEAGGRVVGVKNERGQEVGIKRVWKKDENIPGLAMTRSFGDSVA